MDLKNIETFIKAAELGSFTKAANELGYVQSAITMQIKQLEKELGYLLFDRIGKKVSLTVFGQEFLGYAYQIIRAMNQASNLDENTKNIHGVLRVGVLESLLFGNMLQLLTEFKKSFKNMNLQIKMGQATELLQQLKQNKLDMIYISSGLNTDPELCCYYKRREQLVFVCGKDHKLAEKKKVSPEELFLYDFIVTEHTGICYGRLRELAQRNNMMLHTSVEVDSTIAIASLLKNNEALAFLPEYAVQKRLNDGSLKLVNVDLQPQIYYSQILSHKSRWVSPFMAGLIEEINKHLPQCE